MIASLNISVVFHGTHKSDYADGEKSNTEDNGRPHLWQYIRSCSYTLYLLSGLQEGEVLRTITHATSLVVMYVCRGPVRRAEAHGHFQADQQVGPFSS